MQNFAACLGEHEEDIEDAEGGGRNNQEIHGNQILDVVVEEGLPGLVAAAGLRTILADGGVRDFDSEFGVWPKYSSVAFRCRRSALVLGGLR